MLRNALRPGRSAGWPEVVNGKNTFGRPITEKRVKEAAKELKMSEEEVRVRYEDLAREFGLKLECGRSWGDS